MGRNIENRIRALEDSTPKGYTTFDADGRVVIRSELPALEWYLSALELFTSRGRTAQKEELRSQLARSKGSDSSGGRIYEAVAACAHGPEEGRP
jgi:hypothetical protein